MKAKAKFPLWARIFVTVFLLVLVAYFLVADRVAEAAADGLLHVARRPAPAFPVGAREMTFAGKDVILHGWLFTSKTPRRGTIIYLHGISDDRRGAIGAAEFFTPRGFDVLGFDSRGHGQSTGDVCTFGYLEKDDLRRTIDTLPPGRIVLLGTSLGAAVALQEASDDRRIAAVIAVETFSDIRTIATDRAPVYLSNDIIRRAFRIAAEKGHFDVDAASPVIAAPRITAPTLLIHGALDRDTLPDHSKRVFAALTCPKELILVPNAGHNGSLRELGWQKVGLWLDGIAKP